MCFQRSRGEPTGEIGASSATNWTKLRTKFSTQSRFSLPDCGGGNSETLERSARKIAQESRERGHAQTQPARRRGLRVICKYAMFSTRAPLRFHCLPGSFVCNLVQPVICCRFYRPIRERSEEIPISQCRDHGQIATSVQMHGRSCLRPINRPASREDAAILTSRHWELVGSGVLSISASSSSQMSSRSFVPSDPSRSMTEPTNDRSSRSAMVMGCSQAAIHSPRLSRMLSIAVLDF